MINEIWKKIEGHPRYMVSNMGRVKCVDWYGTGKERICKLSVNGDGYLVVSIDGKMMSVHRIVAQSFIPNPENKPCIDHINTNRNDNYVLLDTDGTILDTNLRWCTHKENDSNPLTRKHKSEKSAMLGKFGAEHNCSIQIVQLSKDWKFIRKWGAAREAERELVINHGHISDCCKGKRKTAGGFKWVYADKYVPRTKSISDIKPLF